MLVTKESPFSHGPVGSDLSISHILVRTDSPPVKGTEARKLGSVHNIFHETSVDKGEYPEKPGGQSVLTPISYNRSKMSIFPFLKMPSITCSQDSFLQI